MLIKEDCSPSLAYLPNTGYVRSLASLRLRRANPSTLYFCRPVDDSSLACNLCCHCEYLFSFENWFPPHAFNGVGGENSKN
nr:MAG TPA: hypothetical protein [Caudoviricetes sp.]